MQNVLLVVAFFGQSPVMSAEPMSDPAATVREESQSPGPYWLDDVRNCGPRCLHFLDGWFGGQSSFRHVSTVCQVASDGVSLKELSTAARSLGWGVTPFEGAMRELSQLRHPAILHLAANTASDRASNWRLDHYVVLLGFNPVTNEYLIFDPPNDVRTVDRAYLASRFSGLGLLVDKGRPPDLAVAVEGRHHLPKVAFFIAVAAGWWLRRFAKRLAASPTAVAVLVGAGVSAVIGCGGSPEKGPAQISRHYDAGRVIEGVKVMHIFTVSHQLHAPVTITRISATCACTHAFLESTTVPLEAGDRRSLKVEFDTNGERGTQRKTIVVETDAADPEWKRIEFTLTAEVFRPVQSIPDIAQFGSVARGGPVTRYVTIESNDDTWAGVEPRVVDGRHVRAIAQPGGTARLRKFAFELMPPQTNGPLDDRVTFFYQQGGRELEVVVPVQADITGLLKVLPRRILVTELDMTLGKRQHLRITAPGGQPFRLVDLELPAGVATVGDRPRAAAVEHDLELDIDGAKLPADRRLIGIVTDLPEDARLEIPLVLTEHAAKKS